MKLFRLETERFDQNFNTVTFLMKTDRPSHPRLGRFSYSRLSTLLLEMLFHFEAMYTLDIDPSFHLILLLHKV